MSWNDLTERQKDLDRAIERCGIKLDDSTTCLSKVMRAIGANPTEASFVKARINLRLKTQMALERADDLISKTGENGACPPNPGGSIHPLLR